MHKQGLLVICFVLACMLAACETGGTSPQPKIGVVNVNRIMVDSSVGRAAAKYVENLQNNLRKQLTDLQKTTEEGKDSDDQALQKQVQLAYSKMQAEQQNVQSILNDVLHRTVDSYRKKHGYGMILFSDVALSFDHSVDVTSEITSALDQEKVEFKPLPEPSEDTSVRPAPTEKTDAGTQPNESPSPTVTIKNEAKGQ